MYKIDSRHPLSNQLVQSELKIEILYQNQVFDQDLRSLTQCSIGMLNNLLSLFVLLKKEAKKNIQKF